MTTGEVLQAAAEQGVTLFLDAGQLRFRAKPGTFTAALRAEVRARSTELTMMLGAGVTDWATAGIATILDAILVAGASVELQDGRVVVLDEERLPPGLCEAVDLRQRGLLLYLAYEAGGEPAVAVLARPMTLVDEVEMVFDDEDATAPEVEAPTSPWR